MVSRNQLLMQIRNLHHHKLSIPQLKKSFSLIFVPEIFVRQRVLIGDKSLAISLFMSVYGVECKVNEMGTAFTAV